MRSPLCEAVSLFDYSLPSAFARTPSAPLGHLHHAAVVPLSRVLLPVPPARAAPQARLQAALHVVLRHLGIQCGVLFNARVRERPWDGINLVLPTPGLRWLRNPGPFPCPNSTPTPTAEDQLCVKKIPCWTGFFGKPGLVSPMLCAANGNPSAKGDRRGERGLVPHSCKHWRT